MKLKFDQTGERYFEMGVKFGVLFVQNRSGAYKNGVVFNGLTGVTQSPDGAEPTDLWADNIKYASMRSAETFGGTIEAYQYPPEFGECNGELEVVAGVRIGQQARSAFGFCYRTEIGSDISDEDGYKLHLVYGAKCSPSETAYETINDSPDAITMSWEFDTTPIDTGIEGTKPVAHIEINSKKADPARLKTLEEMLYGKDGTISYEAVISPEAGANPSTEGWYERSGEVGAYVYTLTEDTEVNSEKTYYEQNETGGSASTLPLPSKVFEIMGYTAA